MRSSLQITSGSSPVHPEHPSECDLRTHDRNTAPRAARQGPGCERAPPTPDPHCLPAPFQTLRGHIEDSNNSHRPRPTPNHHTRSISPTTRSTADRSLTGSPASIGSLHDPPVTRKTRSSHTPIFEPHRLGMRLRRLRISLSLIAKPQAASAPRPHPEWQGGRRARRSGSRAR
jgi:hypothetical protein